MWKANWGNKYLKRGGIYKDISELYQGYIGFVDGMRIDRSKRRFPYTLFPHICVLNVGSLEK